MILGMIVTLLLTHFIIYRIGTNRGIDIANKAFIEKMALTLANREVKDEMP